MYYKIDLNDYKLKKTRIYLEYDKYNLSPYQLESIEKELDNFQDCLLYTSDAADE